ncbi:predicted protein [Chaetoceros tenuissimus]|uniref:Uncharacterized protein n=1 Tax=Chaetoceros tenuissimus TaxID=426638 RepID=A0AAD3DBW8_9STRA|nr:predicted protein [Chaetoceros tenuissimus]
MVYVPQHTKLGKNVFAGTAILHVSPFQPNSFRCYTNYDEVNALIKAINTEEEYVLHRVSSLEMQEDPSIERFDWHDMQAMNTPNKLGITPLQYLALNPYVDEMKLIRRNILELMGQL